MTARDWYYGVITDTLRVIPEHAEQSGLVPEDELEIYCEKGEVGKFFPKYGLFKSIFDNSECYPPACYVKRLPISSKKKFCSCKGR